MSLYPADIQVKTIKEILSNGQHVENQTLESTIAFSVSITENLFDFTSYQKYIPVRDFHLEYAKEFFNVILYNLSVEEAYERLSKLNPNAKRYLQEFEYDGRKRNTLYGPRIHRQLFNIIEELIFEPHTRRAWMQILTPDDTDLLKPLREKQTTIEFPCMIGIGFTIRDNKLNMQVNMRSNNATLTMSYDLYNTLNLYKVIYDSLKEAVDNVPDIPDSSKQVLEQLDYGKLVWTAQSMHIFDRDLDLAKAIVKQWYERRELEGILETDQKIKFINF